VAAAARAATRQAADLGQALEVRSVVRSQLMRQTIHVVSAADFWAMWTVVEPMRIANWRLLTKHDPRTSALGGRLLAAHAAADAALRSEPRSSLEIDRLLATEAGIDPEVVRRRAWRDPDATVVARTAWRHYSAFVALVHVPWEGEGYGRSRYALATDWIGPRPEMTDQEARVILARRYLAAFGPATVDDLISYVGRGPGGIGAWRRALASLEAELIELRSDDGRPLFDLVDAERPDADEPAGPRLLARWDSALLSHASKFRQRIIADEDRPHVFTKNADVLPTILLDGFVAGTWELRRSAGPESVEVLLRPWAALRSGERSGLIDEAAGLLARLAPRSEPTVRIADPG
jgi:hypothetical protein